MTFDSEEHRKFLLEVLKQINVPGEHIDLVYEVKQAMLKAEVKPNG